VTLLILKKKHPLKEKEQISLVFWQKIPTQWKHVPKNVAGPLTLPLESANNCLYFSYDVNLMAILGTMPVRTAPRPLYNPNGVSRLMI
jgi:hypothetical protein